MRCELNCRPVSHAARIIICVYSTHLRRTFQSPCHSLPPRKFRFGTFFFFFVLLSLFHIERCNTRKVEQSFVRFVQPFRFVSFTIMYNFFFFFFYSFLNFVHHFYRNHHDSFIRIQPYIINGHAMLPKYRSISFCFFPSSSLFRCSIQFTLSAKLLP